MKIQHTLFTAFLLMIPCIIFSREKISLAVLDLEGKNVDQSKAEAVTDLLRTELFNTGSFKVIERQKVRQILDEQRFQSSGMTDTDRAAEIGRLLNVQKIMIGTVTQLGSTHIINTRIVDVQSGAVVLAEAIERRGGEEELPKAIAELATTISFKVGLEGVVIRVNPDEIYVDLGEGDGVRLGQTYSVIRQGEVITDLEGRIIGTTQEPIANVIITKVQDRFSIAAIDKKTTSIMKGDVVRLASSEEIVEPVARPEPVKKRETKKRDDDDNKHDVPPIF
jgi:TolB-like protein